MGHGPSPAKRAEWRRRLRRFVPAVETVAEFCDREGVSVASFYHWRRVLKGRTAGARNAIPGGGAKSREPVSRLSFVPVEITPVATTVAFPASPLAGPDASSTSRIEVLLPNGVRLLVPCDVPAAIRTVVAALADGAQEARPC